MKFPTALFPLLLVSSLPTFAWLGQPERDCIYADHWGVPLQEDNAGPRVVRSCFNPKDNNIIVLFLDGNSASETYLKPKGSFSQAEVDHFLDKDRGKSKWQGPVTAADGLHWTGADGRTAFWNDGNTVVIKAQDASAAESWAVKLSPMKFPTAP